MTRREWLLGTLALAFPCRASSYLQELQMTSVYIPPNLLIPTTFGSIVNPTPGAMQGAAYSQTNVPGNSDVYIVTDMTKNIGTEESPLIARAVMRQEDGRISFISDMDTPVFAFPTAYLVLAGFTPPAP